MRRIAGVALGFTAWLATGACSGSGVTTAPRVTSISLSPPTVNVRAGTSVPLVAELRDASGNRVERAGLFWSSSDTSVATVSSSGVVNARAPGSATIAASIAGVSATAAVTVSNRVVSTVQVVPAAVSVRVGAEEPLTARPLDAEGELLAGRTVTWSTNSAAVATVSQAGVVSGVSPGTATITATSEGRSGAAVVTVTSVPVASVAITPATATVEAGSSRQLVAAARDASGATLAGRAVSWSSSNVSIASVSSSGLVVAVAPGQATITATSEGRSGTATVTVTARPVATVTVSPSSPTVVVGNVVQLSAQTTDASGNVLTGRTVTFASGNGAIATVSTTGLVTGVAPGTVTITATSEGRSGSATVQVVPVPVASVDVSPASASRFVGETVQLTAVPRSASGTILTGRQVTWRTGAPSVATVSASGLVTTLAPGTAVIIADVEGQTGSSTITVRLRPVASITITPADPTIPPLGAVQLTAVLRDSDGNVLTGRTVTWSSNNEAVAFVGSNGRVNGGVFPGTAIITATSEGVSGSTTVTVR